MNRLSACCGLMLILLPLSAQSASYDCSHTKTAAELAVCNNPEINRMDEEMTELYRSHIKGLPACVAKDLRGTQRSWLNARNHCK
jgi:uncharacterized protein